MRIQRIAYLLLSLTLAVAASCAQPSDFDELPPLAPSPTGAGQPVKLESASATLTPAKRVLPTVPSATAQITLPSMQDLAVDEFASQAKVDLADRLGVPVEDVTVISVLHLEFSAQAFYCQMVKERISRDAPPEILEGQLILLAAAGEKYEYHANQDNLIFCRQQNKIRP